MGEVIRLQSKAYIRAEEAWDEYLIKFHAAQESQEYKDIFEAGAAWQRMADALEISGVIK